MLLECRHIIHVVPNNSYHVSTGSHSHSHRYNPAKFYIVLGLRYIRTEADYFAVLNTAKCVNYLPHYSTDLPLTYINT